MIKTNETNKTNIKYGALFFNRSGIDECYGRVSGSSDSQIIGELCSIVDFANGIPLTDFDLVGEWEGSKGERLKYIRSTVLVFILAITKMPPTKELCVMKRRRWATTKTTKTKTISIEISFSVPNKRKSTRV